MDQFFAGTRPLLRPAPLPAADLRTALCSAPDPCGEQSPPGEQSAVAWGIEYSRSPRWRILLETCLFVFSVIWERCFSKDPLDQSAFFLCAMRFEIHSTSNEFPDPLSRGRECFAYPWLVEFCVLLSFRKSTAPTFSLPPATSDTHALPSLLQISYPQPFRIRECHAVQARQKEVRCELVVEHLRVAVVAMYPVLSRMSTKQSTKTPRNSEWQFNAARKSYGLCRGSSLSELLHSHRRLFSCAHWPKRARGQKEKDLRWRGSCISKQHLLFAGLGVLPNRGTDFTLSTSSGDSTVYLALPTSWKRSTEYPRAKLRLRRGLPTRG